MAKTADLELELAKTLAELAEVLDRLTLAEQTLAAAPVLVRVGWVCETCEDEIGNGTPILLTAGEMPHGTFAECEAIPVYRVAP